MVAASKRLTDRVLALYDGAGIYGVSTSKVQTAVFDIIPTQPGFEGHDTVETEKGLEGSYFWLWEHFFDTNLWHSTIVEVMRDMLIGQGTALTKTTPADIAVWEAWKMRAEYDQTMAILIQDLFRVGNLAGLTVNATGDRLDLKIQPIPVRGLWPAFNDDQTEILGWWYIPPDWRSHFDPWTSLGHISSHLEPRFIPAEDLMHIAINQVPGTVFGRAVNYQAFAEYAGLKDLHRVAGVLAARQSSRFVLWSVDTDDLPTQHDDEDTDQSKRKDSPALQMMKTVKAAVENRVLINRETGETRIIDNVILDKRVTATDLTGRPDIKGVAEAIAVFKNSTDRKARVPPVFLADPDGSNRATSYNELIVFTIMMKGYFRQIARELERVILPLLGISGELVPAEELIQEDEAVKAKMVEVVIDLWERGLIKTEQAQEQLERLLSIKFERFDEEPEDVSEAEPEREAEAPETEA